MRTVVTLQTYKTLYIVKKSQTTLNNWQTLLYKYKIDTSQSVTVI